MKGTSQNSMFESELLPFDWASETDSQVTREYEGTIIERDSIVELLRRIASEYKTLESNEIIIDAGTLKDDTAIQRYVPDKTYEHLTGQLIASIRTEEFEFGVLSNAETIVERELKRNGLETRNWLNQLFVTYFGDTRVLIGLLHLIGRFKEFEMHPQGLTMALAALSHKDDEVKELAVRAFEHWASPQSLEALQHVRVGTPWLQNYIDEVVEDLSLEHGIASTQVHAK